MDILNQMDEFLSPKLYDLFNNGCEDDIPWYISILQPYSSVLELGIGTGRVAIPLAKAGYEVWGVDNSTKMLNLLRTKIKRENCHAIHIIHQDFRFININHLFDAAIIPFCTFNFILSQDEQVQVLKSLKTVLKENAMVVFDLLTMHTFPFINSDEYHWYKTVNDGDQCFRIYIKNDFKRDTQILKQNRLIEKFGCGKEEIYNLVMRNKILYVDEFQNLLSQCGYVVDKIYGNYTYGSYSKDSGCLLIIAYSE